MPANPHSSTPRAVGILLATGLLIVFAGLAGLGATAISVASREDSATQPVPRKAAPSARFGDGRGGRGYGEASGGAASLRHVAADSSARLGRGRASHAGSELPRPFVSSQDNTAPLAEFDSNSR
jgi:hypothetical protein